MTDMTPQELTALKLKFYDALVCELRKEIDEHVDALKSETKKRV